MRKRLPIDDLTAISLARDAFDRLHPDPPEWLRRYHGTSYALDRTRGAYLVSFDWAPRASKTGAEAYFEVEVNAWTGEVAVVLDTPLDKYTRDELEAYRDD